MLSRAATRLTARAGRVVPRLSGVTVQGTRRLVASMARVSTRSGVRFGAVGAVLGVAVATGVVVAETKVDYAQVRKEIADALDEEKYDDGSYGPVFVRLAWHLSGTYCKTTKTGGSSGGTIRFSPEADWGANAGLRLAMARLQKIKEKYGNALSYGDLYTLAGVVAIKEMGGPDVAWRPGRVDAPTNASCPPDGRLPDAAQRQQHIRDIFYRMGFDDREIVALLGAHSMGRCHKDRSGYDGPWTRAPTTFSNQFYKELLETKWTQRNWKGPLQYEDPSKELMMLPADLALVQDPAFKKWVDLYARDEKAFADDFAKAFSKMLELGVTFKSCDNGYYGPLAAAGTVAALFAVSQFGVSKGQ